MSVSGVTIDISEDVTEVSVTETGKIEVSISEDVNTIEINNLAIPSVTSTAAGIAFVPHGTVTANNLQDALEQLADQDFRTAEAPTGSNIEEGDTWYDTDDNQLKVYRETSSGVFEWVPIMIGNISDDSDTLDAGAF